MSNQPVQKTITEEVDLTLERFEKLGKPVIFNDYCSTIILKTDNDEYKASLLERDAAAAVFQAASAKVEEKLKKLTRSKSSFMFQAGDKFTKYSDEYVWAGGIRQSDVNEKARITRLERIEAERLKKEAETERLKVEAEKKKNDPV